MLSSRGKRLICLRSMTGAHWAPSMDMSFDIGPVTSEMKAATPQPLTQHQV